MKIVDMIQYRKRCRKLPEIAGNCRKTRISRERTKINNIHRNPANFAFGIWMKKMFIQAYEYKKLNQKLIIKRYDKYYNPMIKFFFYLELF